MAFDFVSFLQKLSLRQVAFIFCLVGGALYGSTLSFPFVHDDVAFIIQNPSIQTWENWTHDFVRSASESEVIASASPYYRPILGLLYRVEFSLFGINPLGYHLVNVLLHIANALAVYWLLTGITHRKGVSFVVGILFLIHPLQTEAVACISGVSNLLYTFFVLLSLNAYVIARQKQGGRLELKLYALSLFLFLLSLLCKEQAIVLPLLIVMYELCFGQGDQRPWIKNMLGVLGFLFITAGYLHIRQHIFPGSMAEAFANQTELKLRLLAIPEILMTYISLLFLAARSSLFSQCRYIA